MTQQESLQTQTSVYLCAKLKGFRVDQAVLLKSQGSDSVNTLSAGVSCSPEGAAHTRPRRHILTGTADVQ